MSFAIFGKVSAIISSYTLTATLFLLSFWKSDDTNVGLFVIVAQVPEALLIIFNVFSFLLRLSKFYFLSSSSLILSSIIIAVEPIQQALRFVILFFNFIIFILCFFIAPSSFLRFSFFFLYLFQKNLQLAVEAFLSALKPISDHCKI